MNIELRIEEDADAAARACAAVLAAASGHVALTGGSTPQRAYELAAGLRADWGDVTFWWGDERAVPPDHEWSNYGLAKRSLLDRVERVGGVQRIEGELGAEEAAARYDAALESVSLDVVLLGLGSDGHAASLYPHAPGLRERKRRAIAAEAELDPYVERVTLTIPPLTAAPLVVWLVAGDSKAEAARRAFVEPPEEATPASLIRSENGKTLAILDRAAARLLSS